MVNFRRLFIHTSIGGALALMLTACGGSNDDLPFAFSATLIGAEAVPSNGSAASGIGLVTVDPDRRTLTASILVQGLADTEAHIHEAPNRIIGSVIFPLAKAPATNVWSTRTALSEAQLNALQDGRYYFDVHSTAFPSGEIRGQIVWQLPTPDQRWQLHLARAQSPLLDQQLDQVQEILDAEDHNFTGIGLTIGF